MPAIIIHGKPLQQRIVTPLLAEAKHLGVRPLVALISVDGEDPMLALNRELHVRTLVSYGFTCDSIVLPPGSQIEEINTAINERNADDDTHGIMVLLPLPRNISLCEILPRISPEKELEGLHPDHSASLITSNLSNPGGVLPLVGEAIRLSLDHNRIPLENQNIVILTEEQLMRSNPIANMIVRCAGPAMLPPSSPLSLVPIEHPSAQQLAAGADILVVSLEQAEVVTAEWVKPGATVIDFNPTIIGFHDPAGGQGGSPILRGGIATDDVASVAGHVMPIPGGIGPVMLGILMRNATAAALRVTRRTPATQ